MHRTRTRFAARVHRVATAVERRGIVATYELHDRVLANRSARRRYAGEPPVLDDLGAQLCSDAEEQGVR